MTNTFKPLSGREFPRFSAHKTFFRLPISQLNEDFEVAMFGVPFDGGASYRVGQRFAPTQVRETSSLGRGYHWSRDIQLFDKLKVADIGDCPIVPINLDATYKNIENFVSSVLQAGKKFAAVGGDHSITLPVLRALKKFYGKPLAFIHFDAHLDTYPAAWGCEYHHGSFARHALEEGLVDPKKMIQIGLRGPLAGGDDLALVKKFGVKTFTVDQIREKPLSEFLKTLPSFDQTPTYLSFDVDCLDPAYAPGTGTPVPGGLTSFEAQKILQSLNLPNLVGCDVVEVIPAYDPAEITSLIAVDVLFESLCLMAQK